MLYSRSTIYSIIVLHWNTLHGYTCSVLDYFMFSGASCQKDQQTRAQIASQSASDWHSWTKHPTLVHAPYGSLGFDEICGYDGTSMTFQTSMSPAEPCLRLESPAAWWYNTLSLLGDSLLYSHYAFCVMPTVTVALYFYSSDTHTLIAGWSLTVYSQYYVLSLLSFSLLQQKSNALHFLCSASLIHHYTV